MSGDEGNHGDSWGIGGRLVVKREIWNPHSEYEEMEEEAKRNEMKKRDFSSRQTAVFDDGTNTFFWSGFQDAVKFQKENIRKLSDKSNQDKFPLVNYEPYKNRDHVFEQKMVFKSLHPWLTFKLYLIILMMQFVFLRAHSLTVLAFMIICFLYVSLIEDQHNDTAFNTKRGLGACVLAFCLFGMTQAKDGPMVRPHPAFWRLFLCLSIVYELALVFILFQTADDSRKMLSYIDPELGKPLPEQSYAEDCRLYDPDPNHPGGHFHNFWDKWDVFVIGHLFGWYFKMLMLRDYWLCWVISVMFEVLEYSLEHQLPNFAECWWDHWLMDVLICNGLGIWFGMMTLNYLNIKTYSWRGLWHISSYSGKLKRIVLQFTPYSWTKFEWRPTENLLRWLSVLGIISMWLLVELDTFYLKAILWIPPPHYLNWLRLAIYVPTGCVAIRETYQFMEDPNCKKFGQQSWVMAAIIVTEFLIVLKFDFQLIMRPFPQHVTIAWSIGLTLLFIYTIWRFCLYFFIGKHPHKMQTASDEHAETTSEKTKSPANSDSYNRYQKGHSSKRDNDNKNGTVKSTSPYRTRYRVRTANGT